MKWTKGKRIVAISTSWELYNKYGLFLTEEDIKDIDIRELEERLKSLQEEAMRYGNRLTIDVDGKIILKKN